MFSACTHLLYQSLFSCTFIIIALAMYSDKSYHFAVLPFLNGNIPSSSGGASGVCEAKPSSSGLNSKKICTEC